MYVLTNRVGTGGNAIACVYFSVRPFVSTLSFKPTDLSACVSVTIPWLAWYSETEGHRSRSRINAVGLTSILDRGQFSSIGVNVCVCEASNKELLTYFLTYLLRAPFLLLEQKCGTVYLLMTRLPRRYQSSRTH